MKWLLVVWMLGTPPLDKPLAEGGRPVGPSPTIGVIALPYDTQEACEEQQRGATVGWSSGKTVAGVLRECHELPEQPNVAGS